MVAGPKSDPIIPNKAVINANIMAIGPRFFINDLNVIGCFLLDLLDG